MLLLQAAFAAADPEFVRMSAESLRNAAGNAMPIVSPCESLACSPGAG